MLVFALCSAPSPCLGESGRGTAPGTARTQTWGDRPGTGLFWRGAPRHRGGAAVFQRWTAQQRADVAVYHGLVGSGTSGRQTDGGHHLHDQFKPLIDHRPGDALGALEKGEQDDAGEREEGQALGDGQAQRHDLLGDPKPDQRPRRKQAPLR